MLTIRWGEKKGTSLLLLYIVNEADGAFSTYLWAVFISSSEKSLFTPFFVLVCLFLMIYRCSLYIADVTPLFYFSPCFLSVF